MNRHIVVLAEERATIEALLKRAVTDKPDSENIGAFHVAKTEDELWSHLHDSVSILLISSTFSQEPHTDFVQKILEKHPAIRIITLSNRYGDRTPIDVGAFAVVDKPVRNPVMWAKMDEAIVDIERDWEDDSALSEPDSEPLTRFEQDEEEEGFVLDETEEESNDESTENNEHTFHVEQQEPELVEDEEEDIVLDTPIKPVIPVYEPVAKPTPSPASSTLILDDGDDDDEFDIFGDARPATKTKPSYEEDVFVEPAPVVHPEPATWSEPVLPDEAETYPADETGVEDAEMVLPYHEEPEREPLHVEEETEEEEDEFILFDTEDAQETESQQEDVGDEFDLTMGVTPASQQDEDAFRLDGDDTEREDSYAFGLDLDDTDTEPEVEVEVDEVVEQDDEPEREPERNPAPPYEHKPQVAPIVARPEETAPVRPRRKVVRQVSNDLEHEKEIFTESPVYDEKSEWTKADEGFVAKNGEFVSLVPPRPQRRKPLNAGSGNGQGNTNTTSESGGLFGSVKSLFKK